MDIMIPSDKRIEDLKESAKMTMLRDHVHLTRGELAYLMNIRQSAIEVDFLITGAEDNPDHYTVHRHDIDRLKLSLYGAK